MVFFLFLLVLFLTGLVFISVNILLWWSVFVFMDLIFVFLCKSGCSFYSVINYFVFQECLGFLFLFFSSSGFIMSLVVMTKMGLLPFHYWLCVVIDGLKDWVYTWFLTVHKLPYVIILIYVFFLEMVYFVLFSFFCCYWQLLVSVDYKLMMLLGSVESFNWIMLGYLFSFFNVLVLMYYYLFMGLCMLPFFNDEKSVIFDWLLVFFYVNIPLGLSFFVKVFVMGSLVYVFSFWLVLVMFFMGVFFYSMMVWLMRKSMEGFVFFWESVYVFYVVFVLLFILLV